MGLSNNRWPRMFPLSGGTPGGGKDTLWLSIKVYPLKAQNLDARNRGGITTGNLIDHLSFLLPSTFQESVNHNWEEHQGVMQRLGDTYKSVTEHWKEMESVGRGNLATAEISNIKPDAPLVYRGSPRRELNATFELADQGDIYYDVQEPVIKLQEYSSPADKGSESFGGFTIEFPHVFKLEAVDGYGALSSVISMEWAVLTSVQPSYIGPYRLGVPSRCELTLTFLELEPLYKSIFTKRSKKVTASVIGGR